MSGQPEVSTGRENTVTVMRKPAIIDGAWISMDYKEAGYAPDNPYESTEGKSYKLEKTFVGDKVLLRVKTENIPESISEIDAQIKEDDPLFDDPIFDDLVLHRVVKEEQTTDIFELEVALTSPKFKESYDTIFEGDVTELFFIVSIDRVIGSATIQIEKEIRDRLEIDLRNCLLKLCPRKPDNIFERDDQENIIMDEDGIYKIKEYLVIRNEPQKKAFKARENNTPFENCLGYEQYNNAFKEVEYNFYIDFANQMTVNGVSSLYGRKNISIIPFVKYKNESDDEKIKIIETAITVVIKKINGGGNFRFFSNNQVEEEECELELESHSEVKDMSITLFQIIHPLPLSNAWTGYSRNDKRIQVEVSVKDFPNIKNTIDISIKRNSDTRLTDLGIREGSPNRLEEPNGFWVREIVDGNNDYSTLSRDIEQRLQQIIVFDLDRRVMNNGVVQGRNGVNGRFRHYRNQPAGSDNPDYDTVAALEKLISNGGSSGSLRGSTLIVNGQTHRPFQNLNICQCLQDYLHDEYDYDYRNRYGEIIDQHILIGENNNNTNRLQIDGLLELLQFNENHTNNTVSEYMAYNCGESDSPTSYNGFSELAQAAPNNQGPWYEVVGGVNNLHNGNTAEDQAPVWGSPIRNANNVITGYKTSYRRRHEGRDYSNNRNRAGSYLRSPCYVRIRNISPGNMKNVVDQNNVPTGARVREIRIEIELLGLGQSMYVRHLNQTNSIQNFFIFYPEERIANHPTIKCGTAPHFHIEKWKNKRVPHETLLLDPNELEDPARVNTIFYYIEYTQSTQNHADGNPRFVRGCNYPNTHTQPASPYD